MMNAARNTEFFLPTVFVSLLTDLEYSKIVESYNKYEDSKLPNGVWDQSSELYYSLSQIEEKSWNLLKDTTDYKLLNIWIKTAINLYGIQFLKNILEVATKVIEKNQDHENLSTIIKILEKSIYETTLNLHIFDNNDITLQMLYNIDFYDTSKKINLFNQLNVSNIHSLESFIEGVSEDLVKFHDMLTKSCNSMHKIDNIISAAKNGVSFFYDMLKENQIEENSEYKESTENDCFRMIDNAIEILYQKDPDSLIIPMLKKALKWEFYNTFQILEDISSATTVETFLNLFKDVD